MMKDITTKALETNANENDFASYIVDDNAAQTLYGAILAQSVKDLYNFSYDLASELKKEKRSFRKLGELKANLEELGEFFESPLYTSFCKTPKSVWYEWVAEMIKKPRTNLDELFKNSIMGAMYGGIEGAYACEVRI